MKQYTITNTTCFCPLAPSQENLRRRLSADERSKPIRSKPKRNTKDLHLYNLLAVNSSSLPDNGPQTCEVSYVGMLESIGDNFERTVLSADSLNVETIEKSWVVVTTLGALIGAIFFAMFVSYKADQEVKKKISIEEMVYLHASQHESHRHRLHSVRPIGNRSGKVNGNNDEVIDEDMFSLAEEALPQILSSQALGNRIWNEIKRHHRWLGVIYYFSPKFPRVLRIVSLATNIIIMLFVQSLTYAYTNGDNGACEQLTNEQDCLALPSAYGMGQSKCYWLPSGSVSSGKGNCHFVQPDNSIDVIILIAIFSALVSAPLALLIDWLINHVLAAPALEDLSSDAKDSFLLQDKRGRRSRGGRFSSLSQRFQLRHIILAEKDVNELKVELKDYRNTITDITEAEEFDRLWGLAAGGDIKNWDKKVGSSVMTSLFGGSLGNNTISKVIKQELTILHETLDKEKLKLSLKSSSNLQKTRRLLFLFQRDLIPGISGEILENKEQRDDQTIVPVVRWKQTIGWVLLGGLNSGMLFYVFLFAVSQNSHYQIAWGRSFGVYLVLDIVLLSTITVILMNVLMPVIIMKDVMKIKGRLMESIAKHYERLNFDPNEEGKVTADKEEKNEDSDELDSISEEELEIVPSSLHKPVKTSQSVNSKTKAQFNAAEYLFLSFRLAKEYPDVLASKIILQFVTPWPKQSYHHLTADVSRIYDDKLTVISRPISILLLYCITNFLTIPIFVQDMILHVMMGAVLGYTILLHVQLYEIFPVLVILPTCMVTYLLFLLYQWLKLREGREREKLQAKIIPGSRTGRAGIVKEVKMMPLSKQARDYDKEGIVLKAAPIEITKPIKTRRQSMRYGLQLASKIKNLVVVNDENVSEEISINESDSETTVSNIIHESSLIGTEDIESIQLDRDFEELDEGNDNEDRSLDSILLSSNSTGFILPPQSRTAAAVFPARNINSNWSTSFSLPEPPTILPYNGNYLNNKGNEEVGIDEEISLNDDEEEEEEEEVGDEEIGNSFASISFLGEDERMLN